MLDLKRNTTKKYSNPLQEYQETHEIHSDDNLIESPQNSLLEKSYSLPYYWQALEFEQKYRSKNWYYLASIIFVALVSYAIWTNGLIMAITFILLGTIGYIHLNRDPQMINFAITSDGIIANREIYEFDEIKSFWIFYEPNGIKSISLLMKEKITPHIHIPIGNEDPVKIRELLLDFIPEEKQNPTLLDSLEKFLQI